MNVVSIENKMQKRKFYIAPLGVCWAVYEDITSNDSHFQERNQIDVFETLQTAKDFIKQLRENKNPAF